MFFSKLPDKKREAGRRQILRGIGWGAVCFGAVWSVLLFLLYATVGDTTPLGAAFTVFPPVAWLIPLAILFLPVVLIRSRYAFGVALFSLLLVLFSGDEWRHVFMRPELSIENDRDELRVITWNIAGRTEWSVILAELEAGRPDIVFLEETPDGAASLSTATLTGYWQGFSWLDRGDCGILCRYGLEPMPSSKIGPWDKPTVAVTTCTLAGAPQRFLLCGVRMMMPVNATSPGSIPTEREHRVRVEQYVNLAHLIDGTRKKAAVDGVILAGDFNVRGGSKSLRPLREIGLQDVWPESGRGWGGTILPDFPVARIDQIWVSSELDAVQTRATKGALSDHRMVVGELLPVD